MIERMPVAHSRTTAPKASPLGYPGRADLDMMSSSCNCDLGSSTNMKISADAAGQSLGLVVLLAGLVGVSHGAIFARAADAHPIVIAAYRIGIAALAIAPFALHAALRHRETLTRRAVAQGIGAGIFLALHFATWIASLSLTSIANSVVLVTLNPIWIAIVATLMTRRRPASILLASIALSVGGGLVIGWGSAGTGEGRLTGDMLAIVGGMCMSGYLLLGREALRDMPLMPYIGLCYGVAALLLWTAVLGLGLPAAGFPATTWQAFLGMAVLSQILGHSSYNWALRVFQPGFVAVFLLGEPVLASAFGWIYFGEALAASTLAGGVLVLVGIGLGIAGERRRV